MDDQFPRTFFNRFLRLAMIVATAALGIALLGYAYSGSFMRLSGDDYCYAGVLAKHGFFNGQAHAYLNPVPFHGNRYSLTFFSLLFSSFPPFVNGFLPAGAILFWALGLALVIRKIGALHGVDLHKQETILLAGFIIFISLYTAPDLAESLYWRSAMLPYLVPVIANILLGYSLLRLQRSSRRSNMGG